MIGEFIKTLIGRYLNYLGLAIRENPIYLLLTLLLLLILLPAYLPRFYNYVGGVDWAKPIQSAITYISPLDNLIKILIVFYIVVFIWLVYVTKKIKSDIFEESFKNHLNNWSLPFEGHWSIVSDQDAPDKVLSVTQSHFPGILKEGRGWYDYEVSFKTKIKHDNFTILVRAKDKSNALMLQFRPNKFRPHIISNGIFVVDDKNEQNLRVRLPLDSWIDVKIKVAGDYIDIFLEGSRITYRIPSGSITIMANYLGGVMTMSDLEVLQNKYKTVEALRKRAEEDIKEKVPQVNIPYTFIFDFDIGTIGFREYGDEEAYFRKIKVRRLNK